MAYYCKMTGPPTRPGVGTIMLWFAMYDDTDDSVVLANLSHGFNVTTFNADGTVKTETGNQKLARMQAEFDAYAARLITDVTLVDTNFQAVVDAVMANGGYRYPAAS